MAAAVGEYRNVFKYPAEEECLVRRLGSGVIAAWNQLPEEARDRILQEALATGADPLHLSLVFNIDHTNAMAYANAARSLLTSPAEQPL